MRDDQIGEAGSPWHEGERQMHRRLGTAERMEQVGSRVMRDILTEQHQQFYPQLFFIILGTVDKQGQPWASVLEGVPGFLQAPNEKQLMINGRLAEEDPGAAGLAEGCGVALLGIELQTRRRNRLNGRVVSLGTEGLLVEVQQAFGNCPKFIQQRDSVQHHGPAEPYRGEVEQMAELDAAGRDCVARADTFFVASATPEGEAKGDGMVDVSHRGGAPGFVQVKGRLLLIPDYPGNGYFNTLGNLLLNPKAGLLFMDFQNGDVLQLSGWCDIVFDQDILVDFAGAERVWQIEVTHVVRRRGLLAWRWILQQPSPFNPPLSL